MRNNVDVVADADAAVVSESWLTNKNQKMGLLGRYDIRQNDN
jgi:hypothetical protein